MSLALLRKVVKQDQRRETEIFYKAVAEFYHQWTEENFNYLSRTYTQCDGQVISEI